VAHSQRPPSIPMALLPDPATSLVDLVAEVVSQHCGGGCMAQHIGRLDLDARVRPLVGFSVKAIGDLPLPIFLPFSDNSGSRA
jgi:hypothetical protein